MTIWQIHDYNCTSVNNTRIQLPFLQEKQDADAINVDDTVPVRSVTISQQEKSKQNVFYTNQSHMDLIKDD